MFRFQFSAVMETVGTVYNKAAEATGGLLPRFERYDIPFVHPALFSFSTRTLHELIKMKIRIIHKVN